MLKNIIDITIFVIDSIVSAISGISWIRLVIEFFITSFFVAALHTRNGHERIAENAMSSDDYKEYIINECSTHISNKLFITTEKISDLGDNIKIEFLPRPVIESLFGDYISDCSLSAGNRRVFIFPTNINRYIIKIKSENKYYVRYSIEYEWEGIELTRFLKNKLLGWVKKIN